MVIEVNDEIVVVIRAIIAENLTVPVPIERLGQFFTLLTKAHDAYGLDYKSFKALTDVLVEPELDIRAVFDWFDANHDAFLEEHEYFASFQFFGMLTVMEAEHFDVGAIFQLVDIDASGIIEKFEFLLFMQKTTKALRHFQKGANIVKMDPENVWNELDQDGSGEIEFDEWVLGFFLRGLYANFGFQRNKIEINRHQFHIVFSSFGFSRYEANKIFSEIDLDGDATLTPKELRTFQREISQYTSIWKEGNTYLVMVQFGLIFTIVTKLFLEKHTGPTLAVLTFRIIVTLAVASLFSGIIWKNVYHNKRVFDALSLMSGMSGIDEYQSDAEAESIDTGDVTVRHSFQRL